MLIECSRCRAVFSLQDGLAPEGTRFKVECGRCHAVFEAMATPKSGPPASAQASPEGAAAGDATAAATDSSASAAASPVETGGDSKREETTDASRGPDASAPEPTISAVPPLQPELAVLRETASARAPARTRFRWERRRIAVVVMAVVVLAVAIGFALRERSFAMSVEEKMRRGREILLRDDSRSLEEATKLFTDAARAAPGQAVPEAERAFALLLQAGAAKDLAPRLVDRDREKQERDAARLLQQGAAAARQALSDDADAPAALRASALGEALSGKGDEAAAHIARAESAGPDSWTLYVKGIAALAARKRDEAVQALSAARQLEPRLLRVDVDLAALSLDGGDPSGARALLESVLQRNPKHDRARRMLSLIAP